MTSVVGLNDVLAKRKKYQIEFIIAEGVPNDVVAQYTEQQFEKVMVQLREELKSDKCKQITMTLEMSDVETHVIPEKKEAADE